MKIYAVSYDLNKEDKNYEGLISEIKNFDYIQVMKSMWFIKTNILAGEVYKKLKPQIDSNDTLFISEVTANHIGFIKKAVIDWLHS